MNQQVALPHKWARHTALVTESARTQYLMFSLGTDTYATPIHAIREIIEFVNMTRVPLTPDFLRGVINLRGAVVPVLDLAARFGRNQTDIGRRTCIVIVEIELENTRQLMGVIVDAVTEVLEVDHNNVEAAPEFGLGLRADFVTGMINKDDHFIVALNMDTILSLDELEQLVKIQHPEKNQHQEKNQTMQHAIPQLAQAAVATVL